MNRRLTALIAAAALAAAAQTAAAAAEDADAPAGRQQQQQHADVKASASAASLPAGIKQKDAASDNKSIRETLEDLTEAAVEENAFDDLVERLVDQDRNRIGDYAKRSFEDLNAVGDRIRTAFRQKYDGNFEFDADVDFRNAPIVRGEITDPKQVATNWPVPAISSGAGGEAVQAAATEAKTSNDNPDLNSNIEKGREVAIVTLSGSRGQPPVNVSMVKELQGYRIDIPNTVGGQQLHDNLLKHVTQLADGVDRWPSDRREAAALFAHHVMMAIYDVDVPAGDRPRDDAAKDKPEDARRD